MKKIIIVILAAILATSLFVKLQMPKPYIPSVQQLNNEWNTLVLVNKDNLYKDEPYRLTEVPQDLATNIAVIDEYLVDEQILMPLKAMLKAAKKDNVNHFILNSAYRSYDKQKNIYKEKGSNYALPAGYSEHETGLALDIGSTSGLMDTSDEGKWLASHAHQFGFILRYPIDKVDITNIAFEPWHFRYVGLPHSEIMFEKKLVLEEYIDWIKQEKSITKKINGIKYSINYVDEYDLNKINDVDVSINSYNDEGVIITKMVK